MTVAPGRELPAVAEGVRDWLRSRGRHVSIASCDRPSDGLSSDTIMLTLRDDGGREEGLVVRLAPPGPGAFPEYDLDQQVTAQGLAAANGVPVAAPAELVTDERWLGAPFVAMPAVAGHVPGSVPLVDRWVTDSSRAARSRMYDAFVDVLARIHSSTFVDTADLPLRHLDGELAYWQRYLDWCADGERVVPALWSALDWCRVTRPSEEPEPVLLWGDVRLGNVIFDDDRRVAAVLDWEMAGLGPPEHDVAWWRTLEATQDELFGRRVDGFPQPSESLARYEAAVGRSMCDLGWYEVFALVRSSAVMTRIAFLQEAAGSPPLFPIADNPLVPLIERRIDALS